MPVAALFENLEDGASTSQFAEWFPGVTVEQIHAVLELLTELADQGALRDDSRRLLDTAMLRLRFALERIEPE